MTRFYGSLLAMGLGAMLVVAVMASAASGQCGPDGCGPGGCPPQAPAWQGSPLGRSAPAAPNPAVVRVLTQDRDGGNSGASGVLVCSRHVLTNEHVVRDSRAVWVVFGVKGERVAATVLKRDATWDLAYLEIAPTKVTPAQLGSEIPQRGETLTMEGYGPAGKNYATFSGRVKGFFGPPGVGGDWVEVGTPVRSGDSGGAMFRGDRLVGILWGSDFSSMAVGVQLGRLQLFVEDCCRRRSCPPLFGETPLPPAPPMPQIPMPPPIQPPPTIHPPLVQVDRCDELRRDIEIRLAKLESGVASNLALLGRLTVTQEAVLVSIDALEKTPGPPGPAGPPGNDGANAEIDYDLLAARVRQQLIDPKSPHRLPPLYVKKVNTLTGEETVEEVFLGEGLKFQMTPHN